MTQSRKHKQKLRLLYLKKIFEMETDKDHYITGDQIIEKLRDKGVIVERKTLYDDIICLKEYGMDIEKISNKYGWHLRSREFEDSDLKFLADAVQLSKFLSKRKSSELVNKILSFSSNFIGKNIKKQLNIEDRIKRSNKEAYTNFSSIQQGISKNKQVSFLYYKHNVNARFLKKKKGDRYYVSPLHLVYADDYYYLIAWSKKDKEIRNYRIDRMKRVLVSDEPAISNDEIKSFNINDFMRTAFSMYSGEEVTLTLEVKASAMDALIDRFGKNVKLKNPSKYAECATSAKEDDLSEKRNKNTKAAKKETGTNDLEGLKCAKDAGEEPVAYVSVDVMESPTFYGWLSQFPQKITIVEPESSREEYIEHLNKILCGYDRAL